MINKIILGCATFLLFYAFSGNAQTLAGDFNTKNYPDVSFVWNEYNPQKLDIAQFVLKANNEKTDIRVENLPANDSVQPAKSILFLWEDLNHTAHAGQSDFTRAVLQHFLNDSTFLPNDKFNVAVFNRKGGNNFSSSIHTWLSNDFTSNRHQLAEAVRNFKPQYDLFSNQANSELYIAIEEGIDRLSKQPAENLKAIVIFTAGSNQDSYGGRNSIDEARAIALKIPVYVVKYPIRGCEHCSNIDLISQKTYGKQITTTDTVIASNLLRQCYASMSQRHHGQDYRITFRSPFSRDGQQHNLVLIVAGKDYPLSFTAPASTFSERLKRYLWQTVVAGLLFLILLTFVILLIVKNNKKRKLQIAALEQQQRDAAHLAAENRRDLNDYREQNSIAECEKRQREFTEMMQTKNLLPRLQYEFSGAKYTKSLVKPETTVGRDTDNDVVIINDSVSRHHAKILFNGSTFEIQDLGSTNKVIVNGAFVERTALNNGDIIGLGEIVIYFFN